MNQYLDINRLTILMKTELLRLKKELIMTLVIIFGFLVFVVVMQGIFNSSHTAHSHTWNYLFFMTLGGILLTSMSYRELGHSLRRYNYLMLPASALEKLLSTWLLMFIGWIAAFSVLYGVFAVIVELFEGIFPRINYEEFHLFSAENWSNIGAYFALQALFMVGATHFKSYVFPKTVLVMVIFAIICLVTALIIMAGLFMDGYQENDFSGIDLSQTSVKYPWEIFRFFVSYLLGPLGLVISYFAIKEKEA